MARKRTSDKTAKPATKPKSTPAKPTTTDTVFRLKIALDHIQPAIWRRIETPDCTLEDLHAIIQVVMPWESYHMWEFSNGRHQRFRPDMGNDHFDFGFEDDESKPAHEVHLSDLVKAGVKKLRYTYDFGDDWHHTVTFEKPVARDPKAKYPRCVAGERASPPEDCGGPWGYQRFLEILADPKHPEHEEQLEWLGGPIDPEAFDLDETNKYLQKLKFT